jgi:hypothetical protein
LGRGGKDSDIRIFPEEVLGYFPIAMSQHIVAMDSDLPTVVNETLCQFVFL